MGKVPRDGPGRKGGAAELVPEGAHSGHLLGEEPVTSTRGWSGTERGHTCEWGGEVKSSGGPSPQRLRADPGTHPPIPPTTPQPALSRLPHPRPGSHPLLLHPHLCTLWALVLMLPLQSLPLPALPEAAALAAAPPPPRSPCFPGACGTLSPASGVSSPSGWGLSHRI